MPQPLTEETGREIAKQLRRIADALESNSTGTKVQWVEGATFTKNEIRRSVEEAAARDEARGLISTL